jgi:hypothetical protein
MDTTPTTGDISTVLYAPKKRAFLSAFAVTGNISTAAAAAGIHPDTPRTHWAKDDPEFVRGMKAAREEAADRMEQEALRRAVDGVDEPVFHKGEVCGAIRKYSDTLLIFMLKAARPAKFREGVDMVAGDGARLVVNIYPAAPPPGREIVSDG